MRVDRNNIKSREADSRRMDKYLATPHLFSSQLISKLNSSHQVFDYKNYSTVSTKMQ